MQMLCVYYLNLSSVKIINHKQKIFSCFKLVKVLLKPFEFHFAYKNIPFALTFLTIPSKAPYPHTFLLTSGR